MRLTEGSRWWGRSAGLLLCATLVPGGSACQPNCQDKRNCGVYDGRLASGGATGASTSAGQGIGGAGGGGGIGSCNGADLASDSENCGVCGHSCLGSTCVDGRCSLRLLVAEQGERLAVHQGRLVWLRNENIGSSRLDGTDVKMLTTEQLTDELAFTVGRGSVFFVESPVEQQTRIREVNVTSLSNVSTLYEPPSSVMLSLFWVGPDFETLFADPLLEVVGLVQNAGTADLFASDTELPFSVVGTGQDAVYSVLSGGSIKRAAIDGSSPPVVLESGLGQPADLVIEGDLIAWTDLQSFEVRVMSLSDAGNSEVLATGVTPTQIALEDGYVYWNSGTETFRRRRGEDVELVAPTTSFDGIVPRRGLAVDGTQVFVGLPQSSSNAGDNGVFSMAKPPIPN